MTPHSFIYGEFHKKSSLPARGGAWSPSFYPGNKKIFNLKIKHGRTLRFNKPFPKRKIILFS
ncbi:hypothetical protein CXU21_06105 [Akkermansia muciniphila]|nr:hypothetical protein CXU21_06105 [Akkermansia muciniphila]